MTSEAGGEQARGIGARLRAARERKGLTMLQAAEKLHVDARTLQALEAEEFAALGADVYARGHLRRYAEAVGESPAELQELYASTARAARPDLTRIPRSDPGKQSARLMPPALLVVVGLALAGLLWWLVTLPGQKAQRAAAPLPLPAAGTGHSEAGGEPQAPAALPGTTAPTEQAAPGDGASPSSSSDVTGAATTARPAQLDLRFSAPSWVEISDAGGRRLLEGLIEAGTARTLNGTAPLRVVLGNAAAVTLRLNGEPIAFAALVRRDGSAHLAIDGSGRAMAAAPRLAHGE
jgi:cytoskeleton protein RodZ